MNVPDFPAVAVALKTLFRGSWPEAAVDAALDRAAGQTSFAAFRREVEPAFVEVERVYPGVAIWCKDQHSRFFAASANLIRASMLDAETLLSGIDDHDLRLPWVRQAAVYTRDDRVVFDAQRPKLDIVERHDQLLQTVWLRTSKVPFLNAERVGGRLAGGTVGAFEVINDKQAWALRRDDFASRCGPVFDAPWATPG